MTEEEGRTTTEVDWKALAFSFLLSIGNETLWKPVLDTVCEHCYTIFPYNPREEEYDCGVIPKSLYSIIDCIYTQNFLMCPAYNPYKLKECEYAMQFAQKCLL